MMTFSRFMRYGMTTAILTTAVSIPAIAFVGQDPTIIQQSCQLTQVSARLGPDGSTHYSILGTCNGSSISGELAYASNHQTAEKFSYRGAQFTTRAICPEDPWISSTTCEDQQVIAKGADPGSLLQFPVPLSRHVVRSSEVFQHAKTHATKPNPPGPPVKARAEIRFGRNTTVFWLGPGQEGQFGPYLNFVVEARPKGAEGAAWTSLGGTKRHTAPDYRLSVKLPEPIAGFPGWELRACSTTVLAKTCTGPFIPTLAALSDRQTTENAKRHTSPPVTVTPQATMKVPTPQLGGAQGSTPHTPPASSSSPPPIRSFGKAKPSSPADSTALNPQPLPPKSLGIIQAPSPGNSSALNPQPLPPKSFGFGKILRRGIPEGETSPEESQAENEPASDGSISEEKNSP